MAGGSTMHDDTTLDVEGIWLERRAPPRGRPKVAGAMEIITRFASRIGGKPFDFSLGHGVSKRCGLV